MNLKLSVIKPFLGIQYIDVATLPDFRSTNFILQSLQVVRKIQSNKKYGNNITFAIF